jgi:3',5'-cyclic AMP phosphodiesterase CpdA
MGKNLIASFSPSSRTAATFLLLFIPAGASEFTDREPFLVKPYLQLGNAPRLSPAEVAMLVWHTPDTDAKWNVEVKPSDGGPWFEVSYFRWRRIAVETMETHRIYRWWLTRLRPGREFDYRVLRNGHVVFAARGKARKASAQPLRFAVFGDCGTNTPPQKAIAYRAWKVQPDFVVIPGDVIQLSGRLSEYRTHFFPIYNADEPSPEAGAPLLRSVLFFAALGNHDAGNPDLDAYPDGGGYYAYWFLPTHGPVADQRGPHVIALQGEEKRLRAFMDASDGKFPRMGTYSFDYGNSHWTILDSNAYVDYTDYCLRNWIARDLAAAEGSSWKFVAFHEPPFNSSTVESRNQRMRLLADVFEQGGVDMVFSGHVHTYQRSVPLKFLPKPGADGTVRGANWGRGGDWTVNGDFTLDRSFDGMRNTKASGVIYIISGAGGRNPVTSEQTGKPSTWQAFTTKFIANTNSLTVADLDGRTLQVRQIAASGEELDRFTVTK